LLDFGGAGYNRREDDDFAIFDDCGYGILPCSGMIAVAMAAIVSPVFNISESLLAKIEVGINFVSIYAQKYALTVIKSEK
jgi:hypothetical protein